MRSTVFLLLCLISAVYGIGSCNVVRDICASSPQLCSQDTGRKRDGQFTLDMNTYQYSDFNAISFGDFQITNGDVEGRVAAKGSFFGVNGVSVGDKLPASSSSLYTAIFGAHANFDNAGAAIYPTNGKFFAGSGLTDNSGDATLNAQGQHSCAIDGQPDGCLDVTFDQVQSYFAAVSTKLSEQAATTTSSLDDAKNLNIQCNDASATLNFVTVTAADFRMITTYSVTGCNPSSLFVVNIVEDGASIPLQNGEFPNRNVVFNIPSGSSITVSSFVNGSVLAPNSPFEMTVGTLVGQIYVKGAKVVQINEPCVEVSTTMALSTMALTTAEITTMALTTAELTTMALTTAELTTQALTTAELTTQALTTSELTTSPLTTAGLTTSALTTQALTTAELTTQALTTAELTTQALTTAELTTQALTTSELTTSPLTTSAVTSASMTTGTHLKCTAGGGEDPVYVGYDGRRFEFKGQKDKIFNIYNDPYISLNTLFGAAKLNGKGTIMIVAGLSFEGHQLTLDVENSFDDHWQVTYDGVGRTMNKDVSHVVLSHNCLFLKWRPHSIELQTPRHTITIGRHAASVSNSHIQFPFLEIRVQHLEEDATFIGGVLGQTAAPNYRLSTSNYDFIAKSLFSVSSKNNHYNGEEMVCKNSYEDFATSKKSWTPRLVAPDDCDNYQKQINKCKGGGAGEPCGEVQTCQFDGDDNLVCVDTTAGPQGICSGGSNYDCPRAEVCLNQDKKKDNSGFCFFLAN